MTDLPDIYDLLALVRFLRAAKCKACGGVTGDSGAASVTIGPEGIPVSIEVTCADCIQKEIELRVLAN